MNDYYANIITILSSVIIAVIAALPGIKALRGQKEERIAKAKALEEEITEIVLARAKKEIKSLVDKIDRMEVDYNEKLDRLEEENKNLRIEVDRLRRQLRDARSKGDLPC